MGTTGTIMGVSRYLKEQNPAVQIIGAEPEEGSSIPGIRKWPEAYLPKIYDRSASIRWKPCRRRRPNAWRAGWPRKRASSAVSRLPVPAKSPAHFPDGGERHHRVHRLRPRRPLPVYRRIPRLKTKPSSPLPG
jgi:hypothetical protein